MRILMIAPEPFFEPRGTLSEYNASGALAWATPSICYLSFEGCTLRASSLSCGPAAGNTRVKIGQRSKLFLDRTPCSRAVHPARKGRYDAVHSHEEGRDGSRDSAALRIPQLYDMTRACRAIRIRGQ